MARLLLLLALASGVSSQSVTEDVEAFRKRVRPLIRSFVFSQYHKFAQSELTFRDLKTHVAEALDVPYEELKRDEVSSVIEDETDKITNRCDGGK
ncbi:MAG: hypothetical protein SGPRY_004901, partial [Prymnesium sp.]